MKKSFLVGILIIVLCLFGGVFFSVKMYYHMRYDVKRLMSMNNYETFWENYNKAETINVKTNSASDYIVVHGLKVRNDFEQFTKEEIEEPFGKGIKYTLINDDKFEAEVVIALNQPIIDIVVEEGSVLGDQKVIKDAGVKEDKIKFLEDKKIKTELELFEYLNKTKDKKFSFWASNKEIKTNFDIHAVSSIILPGGEDFWFIKGDLEGYVQKDGGMYWCNFTKGNKHYTIRLGGKRFNKEYILELLNTVEFLENEN